MTKEELYAVRANSDMIVCGYAFSRNEDSNIRVLDLNVPNHAVVLSPDGKVLETNMTDIELSIVADYWNRNRKYMEVSYA